MKDQTQELYMLTGFALTRWGIVERDLCTLFCNCINPHQSNPSDKAYWSIQTFTGKLSATRNLLEDQFPKFINGTNDEILKSWGNIQNRLKVHNEKRNKLAHGSVVNYHWNSSSGRQSDVFFAPFFYPKTSRGLSLAETVERDGDSRPDDRYYASDIKGIARAFYEDSRKIRQLSDDVRENLIQQGFLVGLE